jgi:hypothetical protein
MRYFLSLVSEFFEVGMLGFEKFELIDVDIFGLKFFE